MKPLTPQTPHVVIMMGIPGSGKTHFAEHFAKTFNAPFIDQDTITSLLDTDAKTLESVNHHFLKEMMKTQRTIVYDGDILSMQKRLALYTVIKEAKYEPLLVWVQTDANEALRRWKKLHRGEDESIFWDTVGLLEPPTANEKVIVISGKHTYVTQVKMVLKKLSGPHVAKSKTIDEAKPRTGRGGHNDRHIFIR